MQYASQVLIRNLEQSMSSFIHDPLKRSVKILWNTIPDTNYYSEINSLLHFPHGKKKKKINLKTAMFNFRGEIPVSVFVKFYFKWTTFSDKFCTCSLLHSKTFGVEIEITLWKAAWAIQNKHSSSRRFLQHQADAWRPSLSWMRRPIETKCPWTIP